MALSTQEQAILLINASLQNSDGQSIKPLTRSEWSRFAFWLKEHALEPAHLISGDPDTLLSALKDKTITIHRIKTLLSRGATLGLALEKWSRAGLWVITRASSDYPDKLKKCLKLESPAILFGCGNRELLNKGGLAVIGSRNADQNDLDFTQNLGRRSAAEGYTIISGGARGVDQTAMLAAMDARGTVIGVVSDSLLRNSTSANYRNKLMNGDLVLISPFNPEAGFNIGNAMARNRYIYCLSDAAVVVCSSVDKGGTWNGAIENLKAGWVPLWVKKTQQKDSGNTVLARKGAHWLPDTFSIASLFTMSKQTTVSQKIEKTSDRGKDNPNIQKTRTTENINKVDAKKNSTFIDTKKEHSVEINIESYEEFLSTLQELTIKKSVSSAELKSKLKNKSNIIHGWLRRGIDEGSITKSNNRGLYQHSSNCIEQASLF